MIIAKIANKVKGIALCIKFISNTALIAAKKMSIAIIKIATISRIVLSSAGISGKRITKAKVRA